MGPPGEPGPRVSIRRLHYELYLYLYLQIQLPLIATCCGERFPREKSTLWPEKLNTDDVNRCLHNLSAGHGVSDINFVRVSVSSYRLSYNFEFLAPYTFDLSL